MQFKEMPAKVFWASEHWKRWFRNHGKLELFKTKKACEEEHQCNAVKIVAWLD